MYYFLIVGNREDGVFSSNLYFLLIKQWLYNWRIGDANQNIQSQYLKNNRILFTNISLKPHLHDNKKAMFSR